MNVKRFIGRNSREAMQKVRLAFGDNAVVLSTKPCTEGIEILAMPPESVEQIERIGASAAATAAPAAPTAPAPRAPLRERAASQPSRTAAGAAPAASADSPVQDDVGTLAMSTLSFQDYVRERMLKKRQAELRAQAERPVPVSPEAIEQRLSQRQATRPAGGSPSFGADVDPMLQGLEDLIEPPQRREAAPREALHEGLMRPARDSRTDRAERDLPARSARAAAAPAVADSMPAPLEPARASKSSRTETPDSPAGTRQQSAMMDEIRSMKGLIEERFGALAFMERLQKSPKQAQLTTRLLDCGFSPALIRKLVDGLTDEVTDETAWAGKVLQRNLLTGESDAALEDVGGIYAMIGSTGVGKTTSTAKLAAAFASRHGAANLGLITLDAYRLGAHEQLRAYGRILGVPVHIAHDRVALEDLLDLLSAKKMILIDTAGLAQRDSRTREALEMLAHPSIKRLLVVNAAAQGETIEDVLVGYQASEAQGVVLSKLDEAVKLGPALDAVIRHRIKVLAVANGQRVPEDWHRLTAQALMHRALKGGGAAAWRMDASDVNLLFATPPAPGTPSRRRTDGGRPASRDLV
jgi:flagellar biosynthesis protein FlhF